jgi:hypothetical protein
LGRVGQFVGSQKDHDHGDDDQDLEGTQIKHSAILESEGLEPADATQGPNFDKRLANNQ